MDRFGNQGQPDRTFAEKLAHAMGEVYVAEVQARRAGKKPTASDPETCPLCVRKVNFGENAYRSHLRDRHHLTEGHATAILRLAQPETIPDAERFEEALIQIVNAMTLDDAVRIATAALLGE